MIKFTFAVACTLAACNAQDMTTGDKPVATVDLISPDSDWHFDNFESTNAKTFDTTDEGRIIKFG